MGGMEWWMEGRPISGFGTAWQGMAKVHFFLLLGTNNGVMVGCGAKVRNIVMYVHKKKNGICSSLQSCCGFNYLLQCNGWSQRRGNGRYPAGTRSLTTAPCDCAHTSTYADAGRDHGLQGQIGWEEVLHAACGMGLQERGEGVGCVNLLVWDDVLC